MTVVLFKGYPGKYKNNLKIKILINKFEKGDFIYHAGTKFLNNELRQMVASSKCYIHLNQIF